MEGKEKKAVPVKLQEMRECAKCHCFSQEGYLLRDSQTARFVCAECYGEAREEYPVAQKVVELKRTALEALLSRNDRPGFHAGYLLGKKEIREDGEGFYIQASSILESSCLRGIACFFNQEDLRQIRKAIRERELSLVGIFRTCPGGIPEYNALDQKLLDDLNFDLIYLLIGGCSEIQVSVKDRQNRGREIGVILS